jgi:uncharacterized membrane protein
MAPACGVEQKSGDIVNTPPANHSRLREHLPMVPQREEHFTWRGEEVSRIEGFADAVFAFAVTLLVVALEGPRTFEGLLDVMRGFPAFVICFAFLMSFWNAHYRFYRRYGLEGVFTRLMTMAILVLVLFSAYPLKFLFTMLTVQIFGLKLHDAPHLGGHAEAQTLYVIYGLGLAGVWGLYAGLYAYALKLRERLKLTPIEQTMTRASFAENLIYVGVCLISIALALFTTNDSIPGFAYFLLGPLHALSGWWYGKQLRVQVRALAGDG